MVQLLPFKVKNIQKNSSSSNSNNNSIIIIIIIIIIINNNNNKLYIWCIFMTEAYCNFTFILPLNVVIYIIIL